MKKLLHSHKFKKILIGLGALVTLLIVFQAGILVGFHRANFSHRLGENYGEHRKEFLNTHGALGRIVSISLPTIIIEDREKVEKVVRADEDTEIRGGHEQMHLTDLQIGDTIAVIGKPDENAQIEAKLIRLLAPSSEQIITSTTTNQ